MLPCRRLEVGQSLVSPGQAVEILAGNTVAGCAGLFHPGSLSVSRPGSALAGRTRLGGHRQSRAPVAEPRVFKAWSEVPSMERDFALLVRSGITADKIVQVASRRVSRWLRWQRFSTFIEARKYPKDDKRRGPGYLLE